MADVAAARAIQESGWSDTGNEPEAPPSGSPSEQSPEPAPASSPLPSQLWRKECESLIPLLLGRYGLEIAPGGRRLYFGGHVGAVQAAQDAVTRIRQGEIDRCLVGGADCCIEPGFLKAAVGQGLLKTAQNPAGFLPGEAASFFLLEKLSDMALRKAECMAILGETDVESHEANRKSDNRPPGAALAQIIEELLSRPASRGKTVGLIIGDLNGTTQRASDWGNALVRLRGEHRLGSAPMWLSAQAFGETGAATGALSVCLAATALQRGYARANVVLMWFSSEDGSKGAMLLEAAPGR
jgi:hypothetical protein